MATLTKKQIQELNYILGRITAGVAYIDKPDTKVCTTDRVPNAFSYVNKEGEGITAINKEIGSPLVYIRTAKEMLSDFISFNKG